ncbi:MAG: class I SAM-dependent methyltransferase [Proteobacteria bacterium]|nr:class I SAM-dependent methyltransferase [Pseudomonadota bacterium]
MELSVYDVEAVVEKSHWWFVGRRRLLEAELDNAGASAGWRVLDLGSGTGANLRLLQARGISRLVGVDASLTAARYCKAKEFAPVLIGNAEKLPFADGSFDLILAMDVLEHVEDDARGASEIFRLLRPGGVAIVTVPAFRSLWGPQDDLSHHLRRYRRGELRVLLGAAGFSMKALYYFNYFLFLPIFLARRLLTLSHAKLRSENEINSPAINRVLTWLFDLDVRTARAVNPPFGVSIMAVATKGAE